MRLLKPTPGECVDRQTILQLKIKYGGGVPEEQYETNDGKAQETKEVVSDVARWILKNPSPINIEPFVAENEMIQRYLEKFYIPDLTVDKGETYDNLFEELAEVNHQIWKLTDQQHILRDAPDRMQAQAKDRAAEVLFAICDLNDKRAELVSKINQLFSINVREKLFA